MYGHWMAIGAATVEMPKASGRVPQPVVYEPPAFTACVAHLQISAPKSTTAAQLKAKCVRVYQNIQVRILHFLITGYWVRGEAAEQHVSITRAEVRTRFEEERRAHYATAASFRRLKEASGQTDQDLEFAVETQALSTKLFERFARAHPHASSQQATIAAFNRGLRGNWIARTDCRPGYIVPDCRQYKR
jgi:hypothetical protein